MPPRRPTKVPETASPALRELFRHQDGLGVADMAVAARAGVYSHALTKWRRQGTRPRLDQLEAVGAVLGLRLTWIPIDDDVPLETVPDAQARAG